MSLQPIKKHESKTHPGEHFKQGIFVASDVSSTASTSLGWADEMGPLATGFMCVHGAQVMSPWEVGSS